jgi:flagellar biosynthesis chaperone FliJ
MELSMTISIIACVIGILSFFYNRKDKDEKSTEESSYKMGQIETQLKFISQQIKDLSDKFCKYDYEVDEKIRKAIVNHEKEFHKEKN